VAAAVAVTGRITNPSDVFDLSTVVA